MNPATRVCVLSPAVPLAPGHSRIFDVFDAEESLRPIGKVRSCWVQPGPAMLRRAGGSSCCACGRPGMCWPPPWVGGPCGVGHPDRVARHPKLQLRWLLTRQCVRLCSVLCAGAGAAGRVWAGQAAPQGGCTAGCTRGAAWLPAPGKAGSPLHSGGKLSMAACASRPAGCRQRGPLKRFARRLALILTHACAIACSRQEAMAAIREEKPLLVGDLEVRAPACLVAATHRTAMPGRRLP